MRRYGFGADLGGITCKLGLFETGGTLLEKWEIPVEPADGGKRVLPDIAAAIRNKLAERGIEDTDVQGVGIGVPGAVGPGGVVNRCVNLGWGVVEVERDLSALTGLTVRAANDANIAALGEAWMGAGKGYDSIVMVTLGGGVGGGIILDGKIWNGHNGAAGEIGHICVNPAEEEPCACGNHGCLEQYASAAGIVRMAKRRLAERKERAVWNPDSGRLLDATGEITAKDVFDAARTGVPLALDVVREMCGILGAALGTVCNVVNPEAVVIGGGVSRAGEILLDNIADSFRKSAFHACRDTKFLLAALGNDAGICGGVRLVLD